MDHRRQVCGDEDGADDDQRLRRAHVQRERMRHLRLGVLTRCGDTAGNRSRSDDAGQMLSDDEQYLDVGDRHAYEGRREEDDFEGVRDALGGRKQRKDVVEVETKSHAVDGLEADHKNNVGQPDRCQCNRHRPICEDGEVGVGPSLTNVSCVVSDMKMSDSVRNLYIFIRLLDLK